MTAEKPAEERCAVCGIAEPDHGQQHPSPGPTPFGVHAFVPPKPAPSAMEELSVGADRAEEEGEVLKLALSQSQDQVQHEVDEWNRLRGELDALRAAVRELHKTGYLTLYEGQNNVTQNRIKTLLRVAALDAPEGEKA